MPGALIPAFRGLDKTLHAPARGFLEIRPHGGERRVKEGGGVRVIEADNADIAGDRQA